MCGEIDKLDGLDKLETALSIVLVAECWLANGDVLLDLFDGTALWSEASENSWLWWLELVLGKLWLQWEDPDSWTEGCPLAGEATLRLDDSDSGIGEIEALRSIITGIGETDIDR